MQLEETMTSVEGYKEKITELQSSLDSSVSKNQLLEQEVKGLTDKCSEHQEQAHSVRQRSLELEDLLHTSKTHAEGAHSRTQELEQELNNTYEKLKGVEELEQYRSKS
jgi:chromosome segregation ATPase